ncbi:MAG: EamA family transporter [Reyranellaceae bacterium]
MESIHVAAALLSAVLHASWNAAVKASARPAEAMAAQMLMSAVIALPFLFWTGLPQPAAWKWVAASTLTNTVAVSALLKAYELAGFGIVYPVVRAMSVVLVVPLAALLAGDRLGATALLGIALIVGSLALLARGAGRDQAFPPRALLWVAVAGIATAVYVMCDAQGARAAGSPWAYGFVVSITNAAAMWWRNRQRGTPLALLSANWTVATPTAMASVASYVLILWVWSQAPIAPSSALRDTSSVFAILIAIVWLREPLTPSRILAVLLAAGAVPLLRVS